VIGTEKNRSLKNRFALKLLPKLDEIGYCYCVFDKIHGIRELPEKTGQMAQKLSLAFSLPDCRIIDEEAAASVQYSTKEYPEQLEHLMIRELRNGNKKKIAGYGQHFIEEITDAKADPEQVREYAIRLVANVFHIAKEMKEYLNEEENIRYFMEMILASENRDEVKYQLEKFFNMISSDARDEILTENGMVMNAVSYIRENYREEITLSDVAKVCRVTPEYLSRIFYRETGVNFSPFLQKFRISMAKRMLMTENMKVYEVAEAVGFKDQKYFVTVFKKLCGMTPMEYRKEIRG
jgi:two-component system response regulator YesN